MGSIPKGLKVRRLIVPTPFAVGPVNAYFLDWDPPALVDTGPNTAEAERTLELRLGRAMRLLGEVRKILVTHAHPDHFGLAARVQEISGAPVYVGWKEVGLLRGEMAWLELGRLLLRAGVPGEVLVELAAAGRAASEERPLHPRVEKVEPVREGEVLEFGSRRLVVLETPGHTGGHVCYHEPETGILFSGDTLLPTITPNPLLEVEGGGRRRSLVEFMATLARLEGMDLRLVFPGHGPPIRDSRSLIQRVLRHHQGRKEKIAGFLDRQGKTAYRLAREVFKGVKGAELFLAVSEVIAHLDLLIEEGRAVEVERDGLVLFRLA
jgi:glyoxylase-like metal-dependent hydrolase (beta-lactamase superfamily II)